MTKPPELHVLNGSYHKNPKRKPKPYRKSNSPLGDAPPSLAADERAIWYEVIEINPPGVLTSSDRMTVELLCGLMAKLRRRETLNAAELGKLVNCLSLLGMTPVDRSRIVVREEAQATPFAEFA